MKLFINILLIAVALIFQISLMPLIEINGAYPNLIFIIMLAIIFTGRDEAIWWAGIGGIFMDIFSPFYFGYYTTVFLLVYFILHYLIKSILSEVSVTVVAIFFFFGSIIIDLVPAIYTSNYPLLIYNAFYSVAFGLLIFLIIRKYFKPKEEIKL